MVSGTTEMESPGGLTATATGISPGGTTPRWDKRTRLQTNTERASLLALDIDLHWDKPRAYLVEWFLAGTRWVLWPESTSSETTISHYLQVGGRLQGLDIKVDARPGSSISFDMTTLGIEGHRIFLRTMRRRDKAKSPDRCMLIYCDETTRDFRAKVHECISFALGIYFVALGDTSFSEDWDVTAMHAVPGYSMNRQAFTLPPHPPSPLGDRSYNQLDAAAFNRHVNALCANYDRLHLAELGWAYWHAMCAPAHIGAVHYGAAIEALRAAFVESTPGLRKGKIVTDADEWKKIAASVKAAISNSGLAEESQKRLDARISSMNSLSAGTMLDMVCETVGVPLGRLEKAAWARRNQAAHGSRIGSDQYVELVRDLNLLNVVFNRMLLAMTGARNSYIDYFTPGHPVRHISQPVPG